MCFSGERLGDVVTKLNQREGEKTRKAGGSCKCSTGIGYVGKK